METVEGIKHVHPPFFPFPFPLAFLDLACCLHRKTLRSLIIHHSVTLTLIDPYSLFAHFLVTS